MDVENCHCVYAFDEGDCGYVAYHGIFNVRAHIWVRAGHTKGHQITFLSQCNAWNIRATISSRGKRTTAVRRYPASPPPLPPPSCEQCFRVSIGCEAYSFTTYGYRIFNLRINFGACRTRERGRGVGGGGRGGGWGFGGGGQVQTSLHRNTDSERHTEKTPVPHPAPPSRDRSWRLRI